MGDFPADFGETMKIEPSELSKACVRIKSLLGEALPKLFSSKIEVNFVGTVPGDDLMVEIDKWIYIQPIIGKRQTIGRSVDCIQYQISVLVHDPGVYRYPDGSGQPPTDDLEELYTPFDQQEDAVRKALKVLFKQQVDCVLESIEMVGAKEEM